MPITARLSRTLIETLGDEAAGDMVSWMQGVDDHRAQLRELNELSVARLEGRMDLMESRLNARFCQVDARITQVEERLNARIGQVDARIDQTASDLKSKIDQRFADLIKWSFLFWCGAVAAASLWRG